MATTNEPLPAEAPAAPADDAARATEDVEIDEDDDDDGDGADDALADGAEGGAARSKAGRKKKKKKRGGKGKKAGGASGIWAMPDAEFDAMCAQWLEETKAQLDGISSEADRHALPAAFDGYTFTGELRPHLVTPQMTAEATVAKPDYADDGTPTSEQLLKGTGMEIPVVQGPDADRMREVCNIGREVLDIAGRFLRVGVTGDEIDRVVFKACMARGAYPSPLNYYGFRKSVCVSPNEVICHGIPDCRPVASGDIVNLDISVFKHGFHADLNETFFVGDCDADSTELVRVAYDCLRLASQMIRPGALYRDLGAVITRHAAQHGCAVVRKYCGHGVGQLFHGDPSVPHYSNNKARGIMRPGHVFTVEPMINRGGKWGDVLWPDEWTACTVDGKRSSQFEHTFMVTETGCEVLTARVGTDRSAMAEFDPAYFQR